MTRPLHLPIFACGYRVSFAQTWREEFFEAPTWRREQYMTPGVVAHWYLNQGQYQHFEPQIELT
jgi:hypothetical protein